jgi:hypothetical protein
MTAEQLTAMLKSMPPLPAGVVWRKSYCDFAANRFFCEWEAGDQAALEQVFNEGSIPFDAIHPVRLLNVENQVFED